MKPLSDRIFLRLEEPIKKSSLILNRFSLYKNKANIGIVLSTGALVHAVQKGDKVMFHPFDELETPDENIVVIREKSLLAVLDQEDEF